jgi:hypothetical protein
MYQIREHILLATRRDSDRLYRERRLTLKLQEATDQSAEKMVSLQKVRRNLGKLKHIAHAITERQTERNQGIGKGGDLKRERMQFPKRLPPILNLLNPQTIQEFFGTESHQAV